MKHVVYYEPNYDTTRPNLWQLRGRYKYPSILGELRRHARITVLMHETPPRTDPHREALEQDYGVEFVRFRGPNDPGPRRGDRLAASLMNELERLQATVVSNLNGRSITYCYAAARAAGAVRARYVMRVGGDDLATKAHVYEKQGKAFVGTGHHFELIQQERLAVEMADAVIAMTMRERARLTSIATNAEKIEVCYRGVDLDVFSVAHARRAPCRRFLFIGRKSAEKGYDLLEMAARQLYDERQDIRFTFAGTFEPGEEQNREYIGYVAFDELHKVYGAHDAVIICSRTEGFPQVVMEAMSMGLPCIMSRHLFEWDFEDCETGLFCECSADDLASKIRLLADDDSLYEALSEKSMAHAQLNFAQDSMRRKYHSILLGA
jgi:glycosyltransferase involved in cell wall biosynthesis